MTWPLPSAAASLLASCAERPPATRVALIRDLTDRYATVYVADTRVRQLRAIHAAESERLLSEGDESGDHTAFAAHCRVSVDRAIGESIAMGTAGRAVAA